MCGYGSQLSNRQNSTWYSYFFERSMLVAEQFIQKLCTEYGKHPVYTDGGTWYPQACKFLKLEHRLHSSF
jgi:transposase-like protein